MQFIPSFLSIMALDAWGFLFWDLRKLKGLGGAHQPLPMGHGTSVWPNYGITWLSYCDFVAVDPMPAQSYSLLNLCAIIHMGS